MKLAETAIYWGLDVVLLCGSIPIQSLSTQWLWWKSCIWCEHDSCLPIRYAGSNHPAFPGWYHLLPITLVGGMVAGGVATARANSESQNKRGCGTYSAWAGLHTGWFQTQSSGLHLIHCPPVTARNGWPCLVGIPCIFFSWGSLHSSVELYLGASIPKWVLTLAWYSPWPLTTLEWSQKCSWGSRQFQPVSFPFLEWNMCALLEWSLGLQLCYQSHWFWNWLRGFILPVSDLRPGPPNMWFESPLPPPHPTARPGRVSV